MPYIVCSVNEDEEKLIRGVGRWLRGRRCGVCVCMLLGRLSMTATEITQVGSLSHVDKHATRMDEMLGLRPLLLSDGRDNHKTYLMIIMSFGYLCISGQSKRYIVVNLLRILSKQ